MIGSSGAGATWTSLGVRSQVHIELCRLACPGCGVRPEEVPFARSGSRFTRPFEDTCVWLTRHAPKSVVAQMMRIDWATVGRMLSRLADEALGADRAPEDLRRIGVDEVSHAYGHRYLTVVTCHDSGRGGVGRPW